MFLTAKRQKHVLVNELLLCYYISIHCGTMELIENFRLFLYALHKLSNDLHFHTAYITAVINLTFVKVSSKIGF